MSGSVGYHAGAAAEASVEADYARRGYPAAARRWRGRGGEIDLIARDGDALIFVEVKKSRSFERAAERLRPAQMRRIHDAAREFVEGEPRGMLTEMRFDVALLNEQGEIRIVENVMI